MISTVLWRCRFCLLLAAREFMALGSLFINIVDYFWWNLFMRCSWSIIKPESSSPDNCDVIGIVHSDGNHSSLSVCGAIIWQLRRLLSWWQVEPPHWHSFALWGLNRTCSRQAVCWKNADYDTFRCSVIRHWHAKLQPVQPAEPPQPAEPVGYTVIRTIIFAPAKWEQTIMEGLYLTAL